MKIILTIAMFVVLCQAQTQNARVWTEGWVARELYCLNCGAPLDGSRDACAHCASPLVVVDLTRLAHALTLLGYFVGLGQIIAPLVIYLMKKDQAGYAKFPHPASRFALTGVFVAKTAGGDVRVTATGASQNGVMRVPGIEAALKANWSAGAIDGVKVPADGLLNDIHGSSGYRANLIKVMAQRAVAAAG